MDLLSPIAQHFLKIIQAPSIHSREKLPSNSSIILSFYKIRQTLLGFEDLIIAEFVCFIEKNMARQFACLAQFDEGLIQAGKGMAHIHDQQNAP